MQKGVVTLMVLIENYKVDQIPVLHIVKKDRQKERLPLIIFLHGFTSAKENNLHYAYLLAKKDFRVILPEANYHGERSQQLTEQQLDFKFWKIVIQTIKELNEIKQFSESKFLIDEDRIGVVGTSMGGIITLGALTQYEWIKSAVSLMGVPAYQDFARHQLDDLKEQNQTVDINSGEVEIIFNKLAKYDLSLNPQKLGNRNLLFWHGKQDEVVPYELAYQFYENVKNMEDLKGKIKFIIDENAEHKVTQAGIKSTVNWFVKTL